MKKTYTDICIQAKVCEMSVKNRISRAVKNFLYDDKGDTNFISILIILAAVVALSGVFIAYGDKILNSVKQTIGNYATDQATVSEWKVN